jgi:hypothetical protein
MAGVAVTAALTLSSCAQEAHRNMAAREMMEGQKMKTEAGMMDTLEKDGTTKKEPMKEQNRNAM